MSKFEELSLEDEEYLLNLPYHLAEANMTDDLCEILAEFDFLQHKVSSTNPQSVIEDYNLALQPKMQISEEIKQNLKLIQRAIQLSESTLIDNANSQFKSQLWGRLISFEIPEVQKLLVQTQEIRDTTWLRPLRTSLASPRDSLIRSFNTEREINAVAITLDGSRAICHDGMTLKIWDVTRGLLLHTIPYDSELEPQELLITPDGLYAITIDNTDESCSSLKVWNLEHGSYERSLIMENNETFIEAMGVTPDSCIAYAASRSGLQLWDFKSGERLSQLSYSVENYIKAVVITSQKKLIICSEWIGADDRNDATALVVWDIEKQVKLFTLKGHIDPIIPVKITPDARYAVSGSIDCTIRVWDLHVGKQVHILEGHTVTINDLAITPDGKIAVSASSDSTLKVWDLEKGTEIKTLVGHSVFVAAVAITLNGRQAISASGDTSLKVWDLTNLYNSSVSEAHSQSVAAITISPNNELVISASLDEVLTIWHLKTASKILSIQLPRSGIPIDWQISRLFQTIYSPFGQCGITSVIVTSNMEKIITASADSKLKIINFSSQLDVVNLITKIISTSCSVLEGHTEFITALAVTPDDRYVVSGARDDTLRIWDLKHNNHLKILNDAGQITAIAVIPEGDYALTTTKTSIKIWNLKTKALQKTFDNLDCQIVTAITTLKGVRLISYKNSPNLKFKTVIYANNIKTYEISDSVEINAAALTKDDRYLITASHDRNLRIWNLLNKRIIATFVADSPLISCDITSDGLNVVAGDLSGQVHILRLEGA